MGRELESDVMRRVRGIAIAASLLALLGCADEQTTAPTHAIEGHVVLVGFTVDETGRVTGTKVVGDADGVPVELLYGTSVVRRATTVNGVYRFEGLGPGAYVARSSVFGLIHDQTLQLTIAGFDIAAADTLRLTSVGDLLPSPNPSPASSNTAVFFEIPGADSMDVRVEVLDLGGTLVRRLLAMRVGPGLNETYWDGRDRENRLAQAPLYWLTFEATDDRRAQLLFRDPPKP